MMEHLLAMKLMDIDATNDSLLSALSAMTRVTASFNPVTKDLNHGERDKKTRGNK